MSRLRAVRGVTRVTLSKSDKGAIVANADVDATVDRAAQLCKGTPPSFDLIVFFERAAIPPAALPTGAAAPAPVAGGAQPPAGQPAVPGTPAGSTSPPTTPDGATTAPATQGVSAP